MPDGERRGLLMIEISVVSVENTEDGNVSVMFSDGSQEVIPQGATVAALDVPYILRAALLMLGSRTSYDSLPGVKVTYNPESLHLVEVTL
jgi:hypothetical protein